MSCPNIDRLTAFLDGALERTEQESVSSHLEGCDRCRSECDRLRREIEQIDAMFRRRRPVDIPDVSVLKQPSRKRYVFLRWRPLTIAASILLGALVVAYVFNLGGSSGQASGQSPVRETGVPDQEFRIYHLNAGGAPAERFTFQESGDGTTYIWAAASEGRSDSPGGSV